MSSDFFETLSKWLFKCAVAAAFLVAAFGYGAFAHRQNLFPIPQMKDAYALLTGDGGGAFAHPRRFHLQPSRGQGQGVTLNEAAGDGALILLTGFFDDENQSRLIRRDGTIVRKWSLDYFRDFPDPARRVCDVASPLRVDIHGAHITPAGDLVFNYEYCGSVKLNQCGAQVWRVHKRAHHSLIPAEGGGYWILGRDVWQASQNPERLPPFSSAQVDKAIEEDTLLRVSESGEILDEFSIPQVMRENGLEAVLTANGQKFTHKALARAELVHANKVAELPKSLADAFPLFEAGDVAISMRQLNLIMVIEPQTRTIKWHQTGPWLRQHDPEFRPDGTISIFNNNVYLTAYSNSQTVLSTPYTTNIMTVDPVTRETQVVFGEKPGQNLLSVIRGQHEILDGGGMLITEFDAGRVIETDAQGRVVWEFVNAYDQDYVGEITNAAMLPDGYFKSQWQSCGP